MTKYSRKEINRFRKERERRQQMERYFHMLDNQKKCRMAMGRNV